VQVIFNGKIVTPQSLISRKSSGTSDRSKRSKPVVTKQMTIDESASEAGERVSALSSKLSLKSRMDMGSDLGRSTHKLAAANRSKTEKEETFTVLLSETSTTIHLSLTSFQVASDTRDVMAVEEKNARYEAVIKSHTNVDGFSARATQTKNNQTKNQNEMAAPNAFKDSGSQAISYEIKDEISQLNTEEAENDVAASLGVGPETKVDDLQGLNPSVKKYVLDTVGVALVTPGCLLDTSRAVKPPAPGESQAAKPKADKFKNRSVGGNRLTSQVSIGNNSEAPSDDEININIGGANKKSVVPVSQASSDSGNDVTGMQPSGSRANISQSNAGDSTMDSEDGYHGAGGHYETFTEEDSLQLVQEAETKRILSQPILLKRLQMIERAIQQNANYRNQLDYRDLPDIAPLTLLSPDRAKHHDQNEGGPGGIGKSALNIKKFSDRSKSVQHGMGQSETSQYFSDTASVMSADDSVATGGDKKNTKLDTSFLLSDAAKVKKLFTYANKELIEGRAVTAMAWNAVSSDLLAVGYGRLSDIQNKSTEANAEEKSANGKSRPVSESNPSRTGTAVNNASSAAPASAMKDATVSNASTGNGSDIATDESLQGLVLFWSLRNPDYPEKILRTSHSVTALDFSKQHPMILAVGLSNGDVNIYDVKREGASWSVPVESSAGMPDSHLDPVWNLKWIVRGVERLETLVSISTDGRVLEWNLKKGLVMSKLMDLKKSGTGDGWISNAAAGLSFDFHPEDATTYVTGTEDGNIHRCSVSYNEQYLETYSPHAGPVYRLRFSPRWSNVFMSCSADWTMNLYHLNHKVPLLSMRGSGETHPINDFAWCVDNATVFAAVTVDAKLQIWDLSVSSIDPVVSIDVGAEDKSKEDENEENDANNVATDDVFHPGSPPLTAAAAASRFTERMDGKDKEDTMTPINKLLKALSVEPKRRVLTSVLFGEKNPVVVVGDNRGNVNVYRVFDPLTITHLGPLQQFQKLKAAIIRQTDPSMAQSLQGEPMNKEVAV
jgi:WD40 repeat protein